MITVPNTISTRYAQWFEVGDFIKDPVTNIFVETRLLRGDEQKKKVYVTTTLGHHMIFSYNDLVEYQSRDLVPTSHTASPTGV